MKRPGVQSDVMLFHRTACRALDLAWAEWYGHALPLIRNLPDRRLAKSRRRAVVRALERTMFFHCNAVSVAQQLLEFALRFLSQLRDKEAQRKTRLHALPYGVVASCAEKLSRTNPLGFGKKDLREVCQMIIDTEKDLMHYLNPSLRKLRGVKSQRVWRDTQIRKEVGRMLPRLDHLSTHTSVLAHFFEDLQRLGRV